MRTARFALVAVVAAVTVAANSGCITVPQVKDREVELAGSGSVSEKFVASGTMNVQVPVTQTVDIGDKLDLQGVIKDAGIDPGDVIRITLSNVSYRVVVADHSPRTVAGSVDVRADTTGSGSFSGSTKAFITSFSADAHSVTPWANAKLDKAGVHALNDMLAHLLFQAKSGQAATGKIEYTVAGTSSPASVNTSFTYEIRLTLSVVGRVKTQILT
jgi:hypothetical protein